MICSNKLILPSVIPDTVELVYPELPMFYSLTLYKRAGFNIVIIRQVRVSLWVSCSRPSVLYAKFCCEAMISFGLCQSQCVKVLKQRTQPK